MNLNRQILGLAVPMIISNISTPLLGLVDTAVMGHLDSAQYLAAVALSGIIFSFLYWGVGFLRMGTTGLAAQSFGRRKFSELKAVFLRAIILSCIISLLFLLLQQFIVGIAFSLLQSQENIEQLARQYFDIRIWSAPATLGMYVITGWLIGMQRVKAALLMVLATNLSNIVLDIYFVYFLHLQIRGVALASVYAEYAGLVIGMILLIRHWRLFDVHLCWQRVLNRKQFRSLLVININIFIRTWCLIFAFGFFTAKGARLGEITLAANAVLLNFQTFMAYALDGFAHAAEALVGKSTGEKQIRLLRRQVRSCGLWSSIVAMLFALVYLWFGKHIIFMLTDLHDVRQLALLYLPWSVIMPLIAFPCYLFDGVFIGAMHSKQMRNSMIFSLAVYLGCWYYTQPLMNHGLWLSMISFMLARSISMAIIYRKTL